jgi:hypothetical protein
MAHRRSLGFARDDKKERVVERERTVVQGEGSCWDGRDAFSIDNRLFQRQRPFLCESKKVNGSQDDGFVLGFEIRLVGYAESTKNRKSHRLSG